MWIAEALIFTSALEQFNTKQQGMLSSRAEVIVRIVKEEEEHRGTTKMKDVSLPVCHKSSVFLCDRLADRTCSASSGTHRRLL